MKLIKIILTVCLLCLVLPAFSQQTLLNVVQPTEIDQQYDTKKGANRPQYSWGQVCFGTFLVLDETDSKQSFINYFALNSNRKYKINGAFSHGFGWGFHYLSYNLSRDGLEKMGSYYWEKGKLNNIGLNVNYFLRLNFDPKRGNTIGYYLDILPYTQYNFYQRAEFQQKRITEKNRKGDFPDRYSVGGEVRLGKEFFSIYIRYKYLSYNPKSGRYADLDLAKWSVGINFNIEN